jgi:hypothetical protein
VLDITKIHSDHFVECYFASSADLPQARDTGLGRQAQFVPVIMGGHFGLPLHKASGDEVRPSSYHPLRTFINLAIRRQAISLKTPGAGA